MSATVRVSVGGTWRVRMIARLAWVLKWLPLPCSAWLFDWAVRGLRYRVGDGRWRSLGYTGRCQVSFDVRSAA